MNLNVIDVFRYLYDQTICPQSGINALLRVGCDSRNFEMCCECWKSSVDGYFDALQKRVYEDAQDLRMED
jgi:hypothetical protein